MFVAPLHDIQNLRNVLEPGVDNERIVDHCRSKAVRHAPLSRLDGVRAATVVNFGVFDRDCR
ncbi:hypothetical protein [Halomicrococcus gelatinilyticus]|uniref:hypothetical protein n=1 Tax=Halomicrococcus gelatinilyticus TaxID=1702103 RepID=UPI002E12E351